MNIVQGYDKWSELDLLTGVMIGEARGESTAGIIGVGITVRTRAEYPCWWGRNWREVILCNRQFSCWNDINAKIIKDCYRLKNQLWQSIRGIAIDIYIGHTVDSIGGPTHYHTTAIHPDWASGMEKLATIGNHIFYRDTGQVGV